MRPCYRYAAALACACVTTKQLQQGELNREELMSIGLPLGVAVQLVPRVTNDVSVVSRNNSGTSQSSSVSRLGSSGAASPPSSES